MKIVLLNFAEPQPQQEAQAKPDTQADTSGLPKNLGLIERTKAVYEAKSQRKYVSSRACL